MEYRVAIFELFATVKETLELRLDRKLFADF